MPPPAYDLLPEECKPFVLRFYTERGCSAGCSFCSVSEFFKGELKYAVPVDIDAALRGLRSVAPDCDASHLVIGNLSMFNRRLGDRAFVRALARQRQENGFGLDWWCQSRGDLIDDETARLLREAGCRQVAVGCEGGTDVQLERVRKNENCGRIKRALRALRKNEIETQCYWVIGLPLDDATSVRKTQELILRYLDEGLTTLTHITVLVPYPNTPIAKQPCNHGIRIRHEDWERYWMNCDPFGCDIPAYDTLDRNGLTRLSGDEIYKLWLETIGMVADWYEANLGG